MVRDINSMCLQKCPRSRLNFFVCCSSLIYEGSKYIVQFLNSLSNFNFFIGDRCNIVWLKILKYFQVKRGLLTPGVYVI